MIGASQWVGITLLSLAFIWGFLFVFPKSPVKQIWWSTNKLVITLADECEVRININDESFTIRVGMVAVPSIYVEKISLRVAKKRMYALNWDADEIKAIEAPYITFPKPDILNIGYYKATLYAHTTEGFSKSKKFSLIVSD